MIVLKYLGAVIVAFLVSCFVMAVGSGMLVGIGAFLAGAPPQTQTAAFGVAFAGTFGGVFVGSFCVVGHDRRLASVMLAILGIGFYLAWAPGLEQHYAAESESPVGYEGPVRARPLLLPLALGAGSAILVTLSKRPKAGTTG